VFIDNLRRWVAGEEPEPDASEEALAAAGRAAEPADAG
jgi:hypothetical protein